MANNLYTGVLDDGEVDYKKLLPAKSLQYYAIICMNLSDSCMDVVRRVKSRDPQECWAALNDEFDQKNSTTKLDLLDSLLNLKADGPMIDYISKFNLKTEKLRSLNV
jgi:hypothetical protein